MRGLKTYRAGIEYTRWRKAIAACAVRGLTVSGKQACPSMLSIGVARRCIQAVYAFIRHLPSAIHGVGGNAQLIMYQSARVLQAECDG